MNEQENEQVSVVLDYRHPYIDPEVRYVGVSKLRAFTADKLRALTGAVVFQDDDAPIAVMVSFETWIKAQETLAGAIERLFVEAGEAQASDTSNAGNERRSE